MRKPRTALSYLERLKKLSASTLEKSAPLNVKSEDSDGMLNLRERVLSIFDLLNRPERKPGSMLFFIMYDIEDNKVRYNIVKYLQRQGCTRIQKSIFLADLTPVICNKIKEDLATVQSLYDNHDSIIVCPVSTDEVMSMKIIGQDINFDLIVKNKSTLFF